MREAIITKPHVPIVATIQAIFVFVNSLPLLDESQPEPESLTEVSMTPNECESASMRPTTEPLHVFFLSGDAEAEESSHTTCTSVALGGGAVSVSVVVKSTNRSEVTLWLLLLLDR